MGRVIDNSVRDASRVNFIVWREWMMAFAVALVATSAMQIPYFLGYVLARPNTEYTGLLINIEDVSYYAIMRQGSEGAWRYHIQFTPEEHDPVFVYGFYLALGNLARTINLPIIAMWHLTRIVSTLLLLIIVFYFIATFLGDPFQRCVAYLLTIFGSGLDWVLFPWERFDIVGGAPVDFRMPEVHLFYSALTYPHVTMGIALTLVTFLLWRQAIQTGKLRFAVLTGIVNLAIGIIYPFLIILVGAVMAVHWLYSLSRAKRSLGESGLFILAFIPPLPLYLYYEYVLMTNAVFRQWDAQAVTQSPNPLHYVLAYGVMLALGAAAMKQSFEGAKTSSSEPDTPPQLTILWIWIVVAAILLYAPLNAQRRFVQGIQVPLAIVASVGLFNVVLPWIGKTRFFQVLLKRPGYTTTGLRTFLITLFLIGISTANLVILVRLSIITAIEQPDALFRTISEIQALDWLCDHVAAHDVLLAAYPTAAYVPTRANMTVFVGQRYETSYFDAKLADVDSFFNSAVDDAWREALLARFRIGYVYSGPRERELGNFNPGQATYLQVVYSNSDVTIYRVRP
jgi:hypothetical protein